jgi:hypothetical protein
MVDKSGDIELYSCNVPSLIFHIIRRIHDIFQIGFSYGMLNYAGTFKMLSGGKTLNSFQKFEREIYINYLLENVITILEAGNSFLFHQMYITLSMQLMTIILVSLFIMICSKFIIYQKYGKPSKQSLEQMNLPYSPSKPPIRLHSSFRC